MQHDPVDEAAEPNPKQDLGGDREASLLASGGLLNRTKSLSRLPRRRRRYQHTLIIRGEDWMH